MLGKLFKNEFKNTYKPVLLIFLILAIFTVMNCIVQFVNGTSVSDTIIFRIINGVITGCYFVSLIGTAIAVYVILILHFYRTMYSSQGYLTHTLPVNPVTTFTVKLLVSAIWVLITGVLVILSIALFVGSAAGVNIFKAIGEFFSEFDVIAADLRDFADTFGVSLGVLALEYAAAVIIGLFSSFLFFFTALTIGQLSAKSKIGMSVLAGVVMYFINQVISVVMLVVSMLRLSDFFSANYEDLTIQGDMIQNMMLMGLLVSLAITVIEYTADAFIVKRHINLQ